MNKKDKNKSEGEIELVSIEDLRTAFGGAVSAGTIPSVGPARPTPGGPLAGVDPELHTTMCSGWGRDIPIPGSQY